MSYQIVMVQSTNTCALLSVQQRNERVECKFALNLILLRNECMSKSVKIMYRGGKWYYCFWHATNFKWPRRFQCRCKRGIIHIFSVREFKKYSHTHRETERIFYRQLSQFMVWKADTTHRHIMYLCVCAKE